MKKYTVQEIKAIWEKINAGAVFTGVRNNVGGVGTIQASPAGSFIRWQHYGQSAEKNTAGDLAFIINVIFKDCDEIVEARYSYYHINYIPVDRAYSAIDYSRSHPNVYGL
jgi:hypothetical protein